MNCTDCTARLNDYVDRELDAIQRRAVESHLESCASCRAQLESLRRLLAHAAALPKEISPSRNLWDEMEFEIARVASDAPSGKAPAVPTSGLGSSRSTFVSGAFRWLAPLGVAATVVFLANIAERGFSPRSWSVTNVAGTPRVDAKTFEREAKFRVGQWLVTDDTSRAKVTVGDIGEVSVDPNSRLRLVGMAKTDHRLELVRGSMSALIWAPPRLFFVDTPSATAVDLGCAYTLTVNDEGDGELEVTLGYVSLEHGKLQSIIRMGMKCSTRRGAGPGTPFAIDAPDALRKALTRFDFEPGAARTALEEILKLARPEDAITLWHLLARTETASRARVFDRLAELSAPPAGVTREGILADDNTAMRLKWATDLGLGTFATR